MGRKKKTEKTIEQGIESLVTEQLEAVIEDVKNTEEMTSETEQQEAVIEDVKPEEKKIEERTPERQAVWDFCQKWNSLKNHNVISDADAREIHKYWQIASGRSDFYVHCGVCSSNHIKYLKKKALQYGYECKK